MRKNLTLSLIILFSFNLHAQEFLMVADVMPSYGRGSYTDIMDYLNKDITYPPEAYFNGKSGEANIRFVVTDSGTITYVSPAYMTTLGYGLEQEAMRAIQGMPKWNPGMQDNKVANVWVYLPYNYVLPKEMPYFREDQIDEKAIYKKGPDALHNFFLDSTSIKDLNGIDVQNPVLLDLHIDTSGNVMNAEINEASKGNSVFNSMSIDIAKKLKGFTPAMYKGKAIRSSKTISIDYGAERVETSAIKEEDNRVYFIVEEIAEFPGGYDSLTVFIKNSIKYPAEAMENDISGIVNIELTVNKDGSVSNIKVAAPEEKQLGYGLEEEAIRVMTLMPNWIPAKQSGKKVNMKFTIPISFELTGKTKKKKKKKRRK